MRLAHIKSGLYEVWDGSDPLPHTVYVLGEGSCTCGIYRCRLELYEKATEKWRAKRPWCLHLENASRDYNAHVLNQRQREIRRTETPMDRMKKEFDRARDDLAEMLDDMNEQETDT